MGTVWAQKPFEYCLIYKRGDIKSIESRKIDPQCSFLSSMCPKSWRARQESNLRPLASEANTLSTELRAPN